MPIHGACQYIALDITANSTQFYHTLTMGHPMHVLLNDRPLIQLSGDIVRGRSNKLDALIMGLAIRICPDKGAL